MMDPEQAATTLAPRDNILNISALYWKIIDQKVENDQNGKQYDIGVYEEDIWCKPNSAWPCFSERAWHGYWARIVDLL